MLTVVIFVTAAVSNCVGVVVDDIVVDVDTVHVPVLVIVLVAAVYAVFIAVADAVDIVISSLLWLFCSCFVLCRWFLLPLLLVVMLLL